MRRLTTHLPLIVVTFIAVLCWLFWRQADKSPEQISIPTSNIVTPKVSPTLLSRSSTQSAIAVANNESKTITLPLRPLSEFRVDRPKPLDAIERLDDLRKQAAAGDIPSKLAIYELSEYCVFGRADMVDMQLSEVRGATHGQFYADAIKKAATACQRVPADVIGNRFDYLYSAAAGGNPEAMIAYERAIYMTPKYDPGWIWRNASRTGEIQATAVAFLEQAAKLGVREAHMQLADIYKSGRYGITDTGKAAFYSRDLPAAP